MSSTGGAGIPHFDASSVVASRRGPAASTTRSARGDAQPVSGQPTSEDEQYDWARLDRAVVALVEQQDALRAECEALRGEVGHRDERIRHLEAKLLEANQLRQDTSKRIDELISQLDQLDDHLASLESAE